MCHLFSLSSRWLDCRIAFLWYFRIHLSLVLFDYTKISRKKKNLTDPNEYRTTFIEFFMFTFLDIFRKESSLLKFMYDKLYVRIDLFWVRINLDKVIYYLLFHCKKHLFKERKQLRNVYKFLFWANEKAKWVEAMFFYIYLITLNWPFLQYEFLQHPSVFIPVDIIYFISSVSERFIFIAHQEQILDKIFFDNI